MRIFPVVAVVGAIVWTVQARSDTVTVPLTVVQAAEAEQACEDVELKAAALEAVRRMGTERAVEILRGVLRRRDCAELREKAVYYASRLPADEAEELLLDVIRADRSAGVRAQAVFWLGRAVAADRAVVLLDSILLHSTDEAVQEKAIFGLSRVDDDAAGGALRAYIQRSEAPSDLREHAIFWLGRRSGNTAFLRDLYATLEHEDLKEKVIFALSRSSDAANREWLLALAATPGESVDLRKQALFWVGRRSDVGVADLARLYDAEADRKLKEHLLFVLSRRGDSAAVDKLIDVARNDDDAELRKKAVFWLGRSEDPRVPEFLLELIGEQ